MSEAINDVLAGAMRLLATREHSQHELRRKNNTSRTNDQSSLTGIGISPSAQSIWVAGDGSGSTVSQTLLISCGKAGCAIPTPSSELGNPEVTERMWMSGKVSRKTL